MRRGVYEIILAFFSITVLVAVVVFFLWADATSSMMYATLKRGTHVPREAVALKDQVLACHQVEYLTEAEFAEPCSANESLRGYRVVQLAMNGCEEKAWSFASGDYSSTVPFVVAVQQRGGFKRCLARLEVLA